ncbi:MAG: hypothetical protein DMG53_29530 [Acidobacteria bacterium]|nr:MAG: hypothetical protein DMG53_29530 [Acidobacteriota bacterium]
MKNLAYEEGKKRGSLQFPDQPVPDGNSLSASPAFTVTEETFLVLEVNYKREAEIFFSEPPSLKSIFDDIGKLLPKL